MEREGRSMNGYLIALLVVVAAAVLIPVAFSVIQRIDYRRQISGKKKERRLKDGQHISEEEPKNQEMEFLEYEARVKSGQNFFGPK